MSTVVRANKQVAALVGLLDELAAGQGDLLEAIESKIAAMRAGNPDAIRDATLREQKIAEHLTDRENLRRQLTINIARGYGIGNHAARRMNAKQIADRIGGSDAGRIRESAARLKELTGQVAKRNHVAQLIAQNVLRHVKLAFSSMTSGLQDSVGYAPGGETFVSGRERILDAVG